MVYQNARMNSRWIALLALVSCGPSAPEGQAPKPHAPTTSQAPSEAPKADAPKATPAKVDKVERPNRRLTVKEARVYMLALINRDRATQGLPPVTLDDGAPQGAGQAHAEDMAKLGYLGHWGSDGSVPEQRHTEAGGADMVLENALCFTDEQKRTLDTNPMIEPAQIERAESLFFDEVPPNDGHRKNILKAMHTRVGIGVAQPIETEKEIAVPCFAQEFVDGYGTYGTLPKKTKIGATVKVEGTLSGGARPTGVGVARIVSPKPIAPGELNKRRSYPVPKPYQMYWGPGFVTPIQVKIDGTKLSIDVPLDDKKQPGLYEISIWAKMNGQGEHAMVGLRTVVVE